MKKAILYTVVLALLLSVCACSPVQQTENKNETVSFTDSVGRTVTVPETVERVAVTGPMAQIVVFSLAPDKLVALANKWSSGAEDYISETYYKLPVLGQLYGGSADLNMEELLKADPQVIIDVGESKKRVAQDMDTLQAQVGIPCVHIDAGLDTMADTYTLLGELLGMEAEAKTLADYCSSTYAEIASIMEQIGEQKVKAIYCVGDAGTNVICKGAYPAQILDLLTDNLAVSDNPSSKGTGNEVNMEQLYLWNPEVILFAPDSYYAAAKTDEAWQELAAIQTDRYYEAPDAVYCWMGFPPSVQRYLGMLWMAKLLYPQYAAYDMYERVSKFYDLFLHCDISEAQFDGLMANSLGRLGQ